MQAFYLIVIIIGVLWAIVEILRFDRSNRKKIAAMTFDAPEIIQKKPVEKKLRTVSDITTEMLRDERNFNNQLKRLMRTNEYTKLFQSKLEPINLRLSIKQTKP